MSLLRLGAGGRRRLEFCLVGLLLLAASLAFYRQLGSGILVNYDLFTYFYPYREYAAEALRSGRLPLWNPHLFLGAPFMANIQVGLFYPPNWIGLLLDAPRAVSLSIVGHVFLVGVFTYWFARLSGGLGPMASLVAATVFMFSGFVTAQVSHINQLNTLVWLPLLLLLFEQGLRRRRPSLLTLAAATLALALLAGHPQEVYMAGCALALWAVFCWAPWSFLQKDWWRWLGGGVVAAIALGGVVALSVGLTAAQLLPTLELSQHSIRAGGMSYEEAVSFSLPPWDVLRILLPLYGGETVFGEYVGYSGVIALALAALALFRRPSHRFVAYGLLLALASLALALGRYNPIYENLLSMAPGFSSFRVPARWLYLATFGVALLAGVGAACVEGPSLRRKALRWRIVAFLGVTLAFAGVVAAALSVVDQLGPLVQLPSEATVRAWAWWGLPTLVVLATSPLWSPNRLVAGVIAVAVAAELFGASAWLECRQVAPAQAYSYRPTTVGELLLERGPYRLLSLASSEYSPGDRDELALALDGVLDELPLLRFAESIKYAAILAPNLPLRYGVSTIDGYDGGLLPLAEYAALRELVVASGSRRMGRPYEGGVGSKDAVLRFGARGIPDTRLLSLLGVRYVLLDKLHDPWVDGVYYDVGAPMVIAPGDRLAIERLPGFSATAVGIVSFLRGGAAVPQGTVVGQARAFDGDGLVAEQPLRAGVETAEGEYGIPWIEYRHTQARRVGGWPDYSWGNFYHSQLDLGRPTRLSRIEVVNVLTDAELHLAAASLVDMRTTRAGGAPTSESLVVDPQLRLVYQGDLKLYENTAVLQRAFVAHRYVVAASDATALPLEGLLAGDYDTVALDREPSLAVGSVAGGRSEVRLLDDAPERVVAEVETDAAGLFILADAYYPGWRAWVDGDAVEALRADGLFRAVAVPSGRHRVEFRYEPASFDVGWKLSLASLLVSVAIVGAEWWWRRRLTAAGGRN